MNITFIGTGYVGLVSGVMMSHLGHDVLCIDTDHLKIELLKQNIAPIYEPGLEEYLKKCTLSRKLKFSHSYDDEIAMSDAIFVTVGTPSNERGGADLTQLFLSVEQAAKYANPDCLFVIKSTAPPGTCLAVKNFLNQLSYNFEVASNPEFLREGDAIHDFLNPDRIVVGTESQKGYSIMQKIYKPLTDAGVTLLNTGLNTSEMIKYASNTFLANKIAFINEMADLCEALDGDIQSLARGVGLDRRIGKDFLNTGPGFGGSCFPKDILALRSIARECKSDSLIIEAVISSNMKRAEKMASKILSILEAESREKIKKVAILGLTYKAGTDDLRSSPAIPIIELLQKQQNIEIIAYDPKGMVHASDYFSKLTCADSPYLASENADIVVILTEWPEFAEIDFSKIKHSMRNPVILDLRNILIDKNLANLGFKYKCLGRK